MSTRAKPRWTKGSWSGRDNYRCTRCPYATTDHEMIQQHARERHPLPSEEASPPTTSELEK